MHQINLDEAKVLLVDSQLHTRKLLKDALHMIGFRKIEDVANGVLYLASDESSFVTGSELVIDGGMTAQ